MTGWALFLIEIKQQCYTYFVLSLLVWYVNDIYFYDLIFHNYAFFRRRQQIQFLDILHGSMILRLRRVVFHFDTGLLYPEIFVYIDVVK